VAISRCANWFALQELYTALRGIKLLPT